MATFSLYIIFIEAVEQAMLADQRLLIVTQKEPAVEDPGFDDVYEVGTISVIRQVTKLPGHILRVLVEGVCRGRLYRFTQENSYIMTELSCTVQHFPQRHLSLDLIRHRLAHFRETGVVGGKRLSDRSGHRLQLWYYIKEELGENNTDSDVQQFEEAVEKLKAKKEVKAKIRREIGYRSGSRTVPARTKPPGSAAYPPQKAAY